MNNSPPISPPDLNSLIACFHPSRDVVGRFTPVAADAMPDIYRRLLAHDHHMTVTVEDYHGTPVALEVLQQLHRDDLYAREILLRREDTTAAVQYGIVMLHWDLLPKAVRGPIESQSGPLGRILIEHQVLREVKLSQLWHIESNGVIAESFSQEQVATFGRTARIMCNGDAAIELLEVVAPSP